ncbi:unnamed protein product, partial [Closterium sp. Naga37s-1]
ASSSSTSLPSYPSASSSLLSCPFHCVRSSNSLPPLVPSPIPFFCAPLPSDRLRLSLRLDCLRPSA